MTVTYQLRSHQKHQHLKFAYVDGHHDSDFATHNHDFSELFLVVSGSGHHTVASHVYPLNKGDVFVINGHVEHGFSNVNQLKIINLMFDADTPFFELPSMRELSGYQALFKVEPIARQTADYKAMLTLDQQQLLTIKALLGKIKDEYETASPGFEVMLTSLLQQLVVEVSRMYQAQTQELPQPTLALSRALVFIEKNFTSMEITSAAIAQSAYVSQRQMERLFRQFLNTSPNQYLKDIQLNYATRLLMENSERSVQRVAEECGFSDSNYFSKCFKQKFQITPSKYRKLNQSS